MSDEVKAAGVLDGVEPVLARWLGERLGVDDVDVSGLDSPSATGMSNETMLYTARWRDGAGAHEARHVLRRAPSGHTVFRRYDLSVQYRCMSLAAEHGVPVPTVLWHEDDPSVLGQPFYVMGHVDGLIPSDMPPYPSEGWLRAAAPDDQRRLFFASLDVLAAIHGIEWKAAGFGFLDDRTSESAMAWQLADQRAYLEWASAGRVDRYPELAGGLAWLEQRFGAIAPIESPAVLNWGDARISNVIFRDFEPVAVLDWEMAAIGPREVDVAWFLYMDRWLSEVGGGARLPGFPPAHEAVAHYERTSGCRLGDLGWYEVFAAFRFGIHLTRIAQRLTNDGIFPADERLDRNNGAVRELCRLIGIDEPGPPGLLG